MNILYSIYVPLSKITYITIFSVRGVSAGRNKGIRNPTNMGDITPKNERNSVDGRNPANHLGCIYSISWYIMFLWYLESSSATLVITKNPQNLNPVAFFLVLGGWAPRTYLTQPMDPEKKQFERLIFPTKHVIPKSLSRLAIGQVSYKWWSDRPHL